MVCVLETSNAILISQDLSILDALKRMDEIDQKLLFLMDGETFISLVSIGDIQRAIIANTDLQTPVKEIVRKNIRVANVGDSQEAIKQQMIDFRMAAMPVIDANSKLQDIIYWKDIFTDDTQKPLKHRDLDLPVVIMAGGFGTRLKPITNIIPKPLIPIGEKSMLELILDKFQDIGCKDFFLSVNYKADLIKYYLDSKNLSDLSIDYVQEEKPSGTAGSLSLLKGKIESTFFVSNCDILLDQDLSEVYDYHREHGNELTVIAVMKSYGIPYGTLDTEENGRLVGLQEKPEFLYKINSGIYVLEPNLLAEIPENQFFHITHLMEKLLNENRKVGVFPVSENSWQDIGTWAEYTKVSKLGK